MKRIISAALALMLLAGPAAGWPWRRRVKKQNAPARAGRQADRRSSARLSGPAWTGAAGLAALLSSAADKQRQEKPPRRRDGARTGGG